MSAALVRPAPMAPGEVDVYESIRVMFLRVEGLQGSDRVGFELTPGNGTEYEASVYLVRAARVTREELPKSTRWSAKGPTEGGALLALKGALAKSLGERVRADVGALELAGVPFEFDAGYGSVVQHPRTGSGEVIEAHGEPVTDAPTPGGLRLGEFFGDPRAPLARR